MFKCHPSTGQTLLVDIDISHMAVVMIFVVLSYAHLAYMLILEPNYCAQCIFTRPISSGMLWEGFLGAIIHNTALKEICSWIPPTFCFLSLRILVRER